MKLNKLDELLIEITGDVDNVDRKMKKVIFPVDYNNFADKNYLRFYSCAKQYSVLKKVCSNIITAIENANVKAKHDNLQQFEILRSCIPTYDFDDLEICPEAEELKFKYLKYIKPEKINLESPKSIY